MSSRFTSSTTGKVTRYHPRLMKGVALVEFAMLLGILLPIALGMNMLAKLSDVKLSAQQASRYSTWEATVYSRQALSTNQSAKVESRFFSRADGMLQSISADTADNHSTDIPASPSAHHWWGRQQTKTGLRDLASVARHETQAPNTQYTFDTGKALAGLVTGNTVSLAGTLLSHLPGNSWDMVEDGLLRSDVSVPLQTRGFLSSAVGTCSESNNAVSSNDENTAESAVLCLKSAGVILADGWSASSDQQSIERVRSLVPSSAIDVLGSGVSFLLGSTLFPELDAMDDAFGHVDMQALPRYAQPER